MTEPATTCAAPAPTEVTLADALTMAIEMQRNRLYDGAETLYRRILDAEPGLPDALHFLGMLLYQRGRAEEGIGYIQQALDRDPTYAGAYNNLGNIHASRGDLLPATLAYQRALALAAPQSAEAADLHNNLGALYKVQKRFDEARTAYERAIAIDARHVNAHNNLGLLCAAQGDLEGAIRCYITALELMPGNTDGRKMLGITYYTVGKIAEAAEVFRQWLQHEPEHPVARHMYAACSGVNTPARAPDEYVEYTFDRFAASFEQQLTERLEYQAPQLCAAMLQRHLPPPAADLVVLDAGCGTGLCGPLVAPWAHTLAGVDLSRGMLDQAQTKGVYADLYKAELTEFLQLSPGQWDVVLSADTLCYFGDLQAFMHATAQALRPRGWLVFTVEALADAVDQPFRLQPHGRYAHARAHVRATLDTAGLAVIDIDAVVLRQEGGKPVHGWLVAARRA
jgi:predicted TPR repeat methyltransferase